MSWMWQIREGTMVSPNETISFKGYSGKGEHKNDWTSTALHNEGPIPAGWYTIGAPVNTLTHGPYVLPLSPHPSNLMYDRSGFLIHGDSVTEPGTASEGCIILNRTERELIWASNDHALLVIPFKTDKETT